MKRIQYLVRIRRDPHSDWGASVPDLPDCVATGKTLETALRRIEQAIAPSIRTPGRMTRATEKPRY